jgi:hypothetical protein
MKRGFAMVVFFVITISVYGQVITLDESIKGAAQRIENNLNEGSQIIVYQFKSFNTLLSDFVLKELFDELVNSQKFTVLDRTSEEVVNAELDFQFNRSVGMISDESLAELTERIGAKAIITGSLDDTGNEYRFRIKVIGTETMAAIVSYTSAVVKNDKRIKPFLPVSTGQKIGTGTLNILLGLGSYIEGDIFGGLTITGGHAIAAGLFIIEAAALDRDSPAVGVPATIGMVTAGLAITYGFIRPFIHNRNPQMVAVVDNIHLNIMPAAGNGFETPNKSGVQLTYLLQF